MKVWKKKDWLLAQGYITSVGRGRISEENHARLEAAMAEGVKFSDYAPRTKETVTVKGVVQEKVVHVKPVDAFPEYRSPDEYRFPEKDYKVISDDDKGTDLKMSMRSACNTCGYSLCDHRCDTPRVYGYAVRIVRK